MSAEGGGREVAYRLFAAEYDDASLSHAESDEERAPNYVITPTGARVNRLFVVGTLTEVSQVNDEMLRARVVDPTGAFVVYAGQYQPDELAALERLEPPAFVAVTGKARTFQPEDSDQVYTSIRPESIATVDADTRDRWVVATAEQTRERIGTYAAAAELDAAGEELTAALLDSGIGEGLAAGIPLAQGHYGTTPAYLEALESLSIDAARVVAGDLDQVAGLGLEPDASGGTTAGFGDLARVELEASAPTTADEPIADDEAEPVSATATAVDEAGDDGPTDDGQTAEETTGTDDTVETDDEPTGAEPASEPAAADDDDATAESEADEETTTFDESEVAESESETTTVEDDDLGDFEATAELGGEMYEMADEEREELEAEFGSEFTTGAEVDEPGSTDIDVPEPEDAPDEESVADEQPAVDEDGEATAREPEADDLEPPTDDTEPADTADEPTEAAASTAGEESEPAADDVDLQSRAVETMSELDDGDGADRETVVERVAAETGATEADVEDAIEEALMGGQCYEPTDGNLKAI